MGYGAYGGSFNIDLPLKKEHYYELIELLIFNVILPDKGLAETKR